MAAQNLSRKRPAPGAEPIGYTQSMQQQPVAPYSNASLGPQLSNDEFLQWGQAPSQLPYQDPNGYNVGPPSYPPNNIQLSNQLARRPVNQIATRPPVNNAQWGPRDPNPAAMNGGWEDDVDELEQKAQVAKRDSAAKRKQIPPFVLKLRSFVEDEKNNDLIRWTEDGKSFVVLDEDEFAKKLIPELFKHNNYASFVRQLNMYGFHKKVGLSDNSMRASERKSKSPSEYSNPYFRRGHPDLMWLIQKPKNITSGTKSKGRVKPEGDNVEEGEETLEDTSVENRNRPRPQLALEDGSTSLTQETLQNVQKELQLIRRQQVQISAALGALKREHEQLYGQAMSFQDQHTRHENSINAILTFLATIYTRSLSGNDAVQGITNILNGSMPQDSSTKSGTVVDVGDYNFEQLPGMDDMGNRPFKRQLLLTDGQNRATTLSPASTTSPIMRGARQNSQPQASSSQIQEVFDSNVNEINNAAFNQNQSSRNMGNQRNQQDMMSMIENINARNAANAGSPNTPVADFTNALNDLEHSRGNAPLSTAQRETALRLINSRANQSGDNALINSNPPLGPTNFDRRLTSTKADLDALAKMQAQQDESVEKLTNLLQPLSPSGSIPGIHDGQAIPPPQEDIDDFLRHNEYFTNFPSDGNEDIDFTDGNTGTFDWDNGDAANDDDELFADVDDNDNNNDYGPNNGYGDASNFLSVADHHHHHHNGGGRVESVASSEATTPKTSSVGEEDVGHRGKGRKLSASDDGARKRRKS